ncbi:hypothetical protein C8J56DRAFT_854403 [Mycena floridula]|nr:hypothetical protein C8J56DRAFT_854403 [Mycena floridula]
MTKLYPRSRDDSSDSLLALRIARHSPCESCECTGLRPQPDVFVALDEPRQAAPTGLLVQYGSDDDDDDDDYLDSCTCGHGITDHGADFSALGIAEFQRRARVASRLDEELQDIGKLLDFDYVDEDMTSLRKQFNTSGFSSVSVVDPSGQFIR